LKSDLIKACQTSLGIVKFDRPFEIYVDASANAAVGRHRNPSLSDRPLPQEPPHVPHVKVTMS